MLTITTNRFENDVLRADKPVLVDFWAQWCPYCRREMPGLVKIEKEKPGALTLVSVDEDFQDLRDYLNRAGPLPFDRFGEVDQAFRRIGTTVEEHVFDQLFELRLNIFVDR